MKDKLKIKIWNYKNIVLYEVLEQDEDLTLNKDVNFIAKNEWKIFDDMSCPHINQYVKKIYIRGSDKDRDKEVCVVSADTQELAEQIVKEIKQAVKEFNESQREILDDDEKEYLRAVIKPFRDRIVCITKFQPMLNAEKHYISIELKGDTIPFPSFEKDTMYKNMELGRSYTLEELGL